MLNEKNESLKSIKLALKMAFDKRIPRDAIGYLSALNGTYKASPSQIGDSLSQLAKYIPDLVAKYNEYEMEYLLNTKSEIAWFGSRFLIVGDGVVYEKSCISYKEACDFFEEKKLSQLSREELDLYIFCKNQIPKSDLEKAKDFFGV